MRFLRALLLLFMPCVSLADPILLADYAPNGLPFVRNYVCQDCPTLTTYFDITSPGSDVIAGAPVVSLFDYLDGTHFGFPVAAGTTGVFDFNAGNAPGFTALADRLTDTHNGNLIFYFTNFTSNDGSHESGAFGGLLIGQTIDVLRLIIDEHSALKTDTGLLYTLSARWEVWGGAAVPEPNTLALIGLGVTGLVFVRRRRA